MANISMDQLIKKMKRMEKDLVKQAELLSNEANKDIVKDMQARVRSGFGVSKPGGSEEKFKALTPAYIKQRAKKGLGSKSNLTSSGELVDSMTARGDKIFIKGKRNRDVAGYVDKERPFFHLSKAEQRRRFNQIQDALLAFWTKFK